MPLYPGMPNPPGDVSLVDLHSEQEWIFSLDAPPQITSLSEDNSIYIRRVAKRPGDFDEQRDWRMGRGWEDFSEQPAGFFDSKDAWTMSGQVFQTIQYQWARGLRYEDHDLKGSKSWKKISSTGYISRKFTASANYNAAHAYTWIRRRGNPGTMTLELRNDDGSGKPGSTVHKTVTVTTNDVTDVISLLWDYVFPSVQALTNGTTYHLVVYAASVGNEDVSYWEVAVQEGGSDSCTSSDGSTWTPADFSMYYRVTDSTLNRTLYGFNYDGSLFVVSSHFDGANSTLYVNGDRGKISGGVSNNTLACAGKTWTVNCWVGAWLRIIRGLGKGQIRQIASNTSYQITITKNWDVLPDTTSEFAIYSTALFTPVSLSPALGLVVSRPAVSNGVVYFPQGDGTNILRMRWNAGAYETAADGTNKAVLLLASYVSPDGPVLWRANNESGTGSGGAVTISRATVSSWGTNLDFGDDGAGLKIGETTYTITNLVNHENQVWVLKEDGPWSILNDKPYSAEFGMDATPSPTNGVAAVSKNKMLYFNWLWSTERLYSGVLDDIGQDWRGVGLPDGRQGAAMWYEPVVGWLFQAVDAGDEGTSSVLCWTGLAWTEILRGYTKGKRIRSLKWQPCEGTRGRLWTEIDGDLIFQEFPLNNANPLNDKKVVFQHEFVMESSTIDMGEASVLPKFIRCLTAVIDNLGSGRSIDADYQLDNDVGTTDWIPASSFDVSPESEVFLWASNIRRFRYRLRAQTNDETIPTVLRQIRPSGFARTPFRLVWNLAVRVGDIVTPSGQPASDPAELTSWLYKVARYPGRVKMTSIYHMLNDYYVIIPPPNFMQLTPDQASIPWQGSGALSLLEA